MTTFIVLGQYSIIGNAICEQIKRVNDSLGHDIGDQVLCQFADMLRQNIREFDLVARFGGEEFVIVMPATIMEMAITIAERLRIGTMQMCKPSLCGELSASFGLTLYQSGDTISALLKRADEALYAAKSAGRNQIEVHLPDSAVPSTTVDTAPVIGERGCQ